MKFGFASIVFLMSVTSIPAGASNLNATSDLVDEGRDVNATENTEQTVLEDVPLMQGLRSDEEKDLLRILPDSGTSNESVAVGVVDVDDVYNFYKRTLPNAGWQSMGARDYMRGNETLHINAQADGKMTTVMFTKKRSAAP